MLEFPEPLHDPAALDQLTADTDVAFRAIALDRFRLDLAAFAQQVGVAQGLERRRLLHTMSSSAALMGAMRLAALCLDFETRAVPLSEAEIAQAVALARQTAALYATL